PAQGQSTPPFSKYLHYECRNSSGGRSLKLHTVETPPHPEHSTRSGKKRLRSLHRSSLLRSPILHKVPCPPQTSCNRSRGAPAATPPLHEDPRSTHRGSARAAQTSDRDSRSQRRADARDHTPQKSFP